MEALELRAGAKLELEDNEEIGCGFSSANITGWRQRHKGEHNGALLEHDPNSSANFEQTDTLIIQNDD